ncbi:MAG: carbamoyltransferase HypF [Methanobacteriota archaeon]
MGSQGRIIIRGIVQGVGFRPFVYAKAQELGIVGSVQNAGSEVRICAYGDRFEEFCDLVSQGTPLSVIDSVEVRPLQGEYPQDFLIIPSATGVLSGLIPPDIATCNDCIQDIFTTKGRYEKYFGTSCVNCGPRYSIIRTLPYDRERTAMDNFPPCPTCNAEYNDPGCRRHHAQTIACTTCGPALTLCTAKGDPIRVSDPIKEVATLLDRGEIIGIRGLGGFHIACIGQSVRTLKERLGRTEQPLAIMAPLQVIRRLTSLSSEEEETLLSPACPIVVLDKKDPDILLEVSNLHTLGCMLPYTGLHHLLFSHLQAPFLIMTSANIPGYPMITDPDVITSRLQGTIEYMLTHNREIVNRCDDSVIRKGLIIRLSRGYAPKRTRQDLGNQSILGVGPELNANVTFYQKGFAITSPHVGNVRNPATYAYLQETIERLSRLLNPDIRVIAHDLHPQFLSTRLAKEMAEESGASLVPVQHHMAHIAGACQEPCVGIAIDGVGYGTDGTVWGGEIFTGEVPHLKRTAHLEPVLMPGGDLATKFPERMLYGVIPDEDTAEILAIRGWNEIDLRILEQQVTKRFNTMQTTSTGRILDAAAALLGICRQKTYDGEPAMRLESTAWGKKPEIWQLAFSCDGNHRTFDTPSLLRTARSKYLSTDGNRARIGTIAASIQYNLARGIAQLAADAADEAGYSRVALSGGVAYNESIRTTIEEEIRSRGLELVINREHPLGDGCISYGQCVWAGMLD